MEVCPIYPWNEMFYRRETCSLYDSSFGYGRATSSAPEGHRGILDGEAVVLSVISGYGELYCMDLRGEIMVGGDNP
jgi:hypothetical protein